jgi:hypothetical protein
MKAASSVEGVLARAAHDARSLQGAVRRLAAVRLAAPVRDPATCGETRGTGSIAFDEPPESYDWTIVMQAT